VIPISKIGGWSDHAVATDNNLIRIPENIDPLQAAMLKVNPATARLLLTAFETLEKGDWVALNASNSGVGQCTVQLATAMGIRTICFLRDTGIASELKKLGATQVFEDTQEGFTEAREILGKDRAKLAFNAVGGESALRIMKLLGAGGTHVTYGAMGRKPLTVPNGPLIFNDLRVRGLWVTKWIENCERSELEKAYTELAGLITEGSLAQVVDTTFDLTDFSQALVRLEDTKRKGKVLFSKSLSN
jgi:trans-2-enoyl-CoA reductase